MTNRIRDDIENRANRLQNLISDIEGIYRSLPPGNIMIKKRGNKEYYYLRNNKYTCLVSGEDMELVKAIVYKSYLELVLRSAKLEYKALMAARAKFPDISFEQIYDNLPPSRQNLIEPIGQTDLDFVREWQERPYKHKGFKPNTPKYYTMKGERVRSKSEVIIADRLAARGIPYKYECPVKLKNGLVLHPDFTILRVSDRKQIYLEHLGSLGDPEYADLNVMRLNDYTLSGLTVGEDLFFTCETDKVPLDTRVLDIFIEKLFR